MTPNDILDSEHRRAAADRPTIFDQRGQQVGQQVNVAGDYVVQRTGPKYDIHIEHAEGLAIGDGARVESTRSHGGQGRPPVTPSPSNGWNTAAIRVLLSAAFSDEELTSLCFDHFLTVYEEFSTAMSKGQKIQLLLEHCVRHGRLDDLVRLVQEMNPAQYRHFAERLRE